MTPTPKSLIVDLLSTLPKPPQGSMPVRALIAAGRCFGIAENSMRVALTRLHAAGTVDRDERGRYRLGERTESTRREVASWKTRHESVVTWTECRWIGLFSNDSGRLGRRAEHSRARALGLLGFRALAPASASSGLHVRPDNLAGGALRARERLVALDPSIGTDAHLVVGLSDLDAEAERRARSLWDVDAIVSAYAHARQRLAHSAAHLHECSPDEAMVETFLIGGQVLRQVAMDPLLPDEIVPAADRAALVEDMRRYDELGRACWAEFLGRFDVPHMRTPTDLRVADAALHAFPSAHPKSALSAD